MALAKDRGISIARIQENFAHFNGHFLPFYVTCHPKGQLHSNLIFTQTLRQELLERDIGGFVSWRMATRNAAVSSFNLLTIFGPRDKSLVQAKRIEAVLNGLVSNVIMKVCTARGYFSSDSHVAKRHSTRTIEGEGMRRWVVSLLLDVSLNTVRRCSYENRVV